MEFSETAPEHVNQELGTTFHGLLITLQHVLVSRDNMALSLHNEARRGDLVLDEQLATVCRIGEGKIVAIETYLSDVDGMNTFFADLP